MNDRVAANEGGYAVTDPKMIHICQQLETAPEWAKDRFLRYAIRLTNNDPKLSRLIELRDKGFISNQEFWRRM